jgi:hypothetical protein
MTPEELFHFDLRGYLLFPAVLSAEELAPIKAQALALRQDRDSLPAAHRRLPGGPASALIDHPKVMDVLNTVISRTDKVRCENCFLAWRERDEGAGQWRPHAGGRSVNPNYSYQYHDGRVYSGMTRVVWELNEVPHGRGGTSFIPGSHKANFEFPEAVDDPGSGYWETYGCPPGSLFIFTEAMRHTTTPWTHGSPRCALFFCYNSINVRHHKPDFPEEMLADLTPERRRFFNEVYHPQFDKPPFAKA